MKEVEVGEGKILIIKDKEKVFATGNKCTHYGAPLKTGVSTYIYIYNHYSHSYFYSYMDVYSYLLPYIYNNNNTNTRSILKVVFVVLGMERVSL